MEEIKDPAGMIIEETKTGGNMLTIDTSGGHQLGSSYETKMDINDLRKNKTKYLDVNTNNLLKGMY